MRLKKQKPMVHTCKFCKTSKTLDGLFHQGVPLRKIRRKLRECLLISEENGRKGFTPKGKVGYLYEQEKHLTQYYYMIHPHSKFREYWEISVVIEIMFSLIIRAFLVSQFRFRALEDFGYQMFGIFCDMFEMTDIALLFVTGYLDKETRIIALEPRKIFYHNIQQIYFPVSLIGSFPFDFLLYLIFRPRKYAIFLFFIFLKIFKLPTVKRYIIHFSKIYNWSELVLRGICVAVTMLTLSHWLTCLFYMVVYGKEFGQVDGRFEEEYSCFYRHLAMFYIVAAVVFYQNGISDDLHFTTTKDVLIFTFVIFTTTIANIIFLGLLIQVLGLKRTSFVQYEEMIQIVQKFLMQENLPKHIHKKVVHYFQFCFRYRYFRENIILDTLSPPLKQELANFFCMKFLVDPDSIFYGIPQQLAESLCVKMKYQVFLAGDVMVRAGKEAKRMYFLSCGSVALYSRRGKEVEHFYEGGQFGQSMLSFENFYTATVLSLETCECYYLTYRDASRCFSEYPEYRMKVMSAANKFRNKYLVYDTL